MNPRLLFLLQVLFALAAALVVVAAATGEAGLLRLLSGSPWR